MTQTFKEIVLGRSLSVFWILFLFLFASTEAQAYSYRTCGGGKIRNNYGLAFMFISTTSFPAGSSKDKRLQTAMARWNNVKALGSTSS